MPLSRRQFFRRFWNPSERTLEDRLRRYSALESYVRTSLLPYDFALTDEQYSELLTEVRTNLESTNDEDLFSPEMYRLMGVIAETKLQPWREAYWLQQDRN